MQLRESACSSLRSWVHPDVEICSSFHQSLFRLWPSNCGIHACALCSVVGIATMLLAERSGVQILAETRDFSLLRSVQIGCAAHPASYSMIIGIFPWISSRGVKLIIHLHLVPRLKMSGAIPLYPPCLWTAENLPLSCNPLLLSSNLLLRIFRPTDFSIFWNLSANI